MEALVSNIYLLLSTMRAITMYVDTTRYLEIFVIFYSMDGVNKYCQLYTIKQSLDRDLGLVSL